ncbi:hypothetical protein DFA_10474 [Cavenderia fasciculata]|uniref:Bulb-type lectin domain-containing protein n=1 Tax=Cavenderia fasciculata TaxID=261658 RepID=F4QAB3_CACFS|nr:uncharacterized protein DFA_10474 [Cavenderia fasciculata]EGG15632.1 hypothetical protein DFA_10474 [Cavenderia fasciculata]|eukprot:XP_004354374.1 hypothetical protein DFA_10474 [Cavenderia fasciculata]
MKRIILLSTLLFVLLLSVAAVIGQQSPCYADASSLLDKYNAGVAFNKLVDSTTSALGSAVGFLTGGAGGAIASAIGGRLAKMYVKEDTTKYLAKYVKATITFAIECNEITDARESLEKAVDSFEVYLKCIEAPLDEMQGRCTEYDRAQLGTSFKIALAAYRKDFFYQASDEGRSLNLKVATLPLFVQYSNLYLGVLRDNIANVYNVNWTETSISIMRSELAEYASGAAIFANDVYNRYVATIDNSDVLLADDYNQMAEFVNMMSLGVHDQVYYWAYLDPITYPYGAPPRPTRTMYSPLVGQLQGYEHKLLPSGMNFPNPLKSNVAPCTRPINPSQINVYVEHEWNSGSRDYIDGVPGLKFTSTAPPISVLTGYDESSYPVKLAGTVTTTRPDYINAITTEYGNYIDRIAFNTTKGVVSPAFGDTQHGGNTVTISYGSGYYLSGACITSVFLGQTTAAASASQTASSIIYLFSSVPVISKPIIPALVYRYHDTSSLMGMGYHYSTQSNIQMANWVNEGAVYGAFTYNTTNTATATVHQYHTQGSDGKSSYQYHIGAAEGLDASIFTYDYPAFNVYTTAVAGTAPIFRHASSVGHYQVLTSESFIPGYINLGIAWYSNITTINANTLIVGPQDIAFKQLKNVANNLCLSASATTGKPSLKTCDSSNGLQVWRFVQNNFGRPLTNTLTKLVLSKTYTNTAALSAPAHDFSLASIFYYKVLGTNQFMIQNSATGLCLASPTDVNTDLVYVVCNSADTKHLWGVAPQGYATYTDKSIGFVLGAVMDVNEVFGPSTIYSSGATNYFPLDMRGSGISSGLFINKGSLKVARSDMGWVWNSNTDIPVTSSTPYKAAIQADGNLCVTLASGSVTPTYCTYTQGLGGTMVNLLQPGAYGREWGIVITNPAGKMVWGRFGQAQSNRIALIPGSFLDMLDPNNFQLKSGQFITNGRDYIYVYQSAANVMTTYYTTESPHSATVKTHWREDVTTAAFSTITYRLFENGACVAGQYANEPQNVYLVNCLGGGGNNKNYPNLRYFQIPPPASHDLPAEENAIVYRTATGSVIWGIFNVARLYDNYSLYPYELTNDFMGTSFLYASFTPTQYTLTSLKTNTVLNRSPVGKKRCRKGWLESNHIFEVIYSDNANDCAPGEWDGLVYGLSKPFKGNRFVLVASMPEMVLVDSTGQYLEGTSYSTL